MLNNEIAAERMLVGMFRRKSTAEVEGEVCPYCEFVNKAGSATCAQCYYELNKAPRDQGEPLSAEVSNSIFDELMADDDDSPRFLGFLGLVHRVPWLVSRVPRIPRPGSSGSLGS